MHGEDAPANSPVFMSLCCRKVETHMCVDGVLRHALGLSVHEADAVLGGRAVLRGCLAIPFHRLGVVLRHAQAIAVHSAENVLGNRVGCGRPIEALS